MAEIAALPWNGLSVVSTFSGCGGSCLGYRMAGYRVLWANEFIPAAQQVYKLNHSDSILDTRDIRTVQAADILAAIGLQVGELDLFDGSPPCASFSTAGKREAGWGKVKYYSDTKQRTDDLFFEYARLLKGLQPRVFVAENVSGLVKGTAKGYFKEILATLKACGYRVEAKLLDAQWLGVPQMRQRIIFQGARLDLGYAPAFPAPLPYRYSVAEAIDTPCQYVRYGGHIDNWMNAQQVPSGTIVQSDATTSKTAYLSCGGWIDTGTEKRKFTIAELKRICAFPDDFLLTGTYAQQWERLGRAVPPVMMSHIARIIAERVLQ